MQRRSVLFRRFATLFILFGITFSIVFGQKKPAPTKPPTCSGAWTGNITFSRTQTLTDSKVTPRVSARGKDTRETEMKLRYRASVAVLEAPEKNGSSIGKATINSTLTMTDNTLAEEENSCDRGKTFQLMTGTFANQTKISGGGTGEASVSIGVNSDGTYSVGVSLPQVAGQSSGSQTGSYSGQCWPKEGYNVASPPTPANVQGASFRSNGTDRVDPNNLNKISGSWSETALGITNTITWSLQRCGGELRISDLQFEDMKFPNWDDWQQIIEPGGTIDGNLVKIKAIVLNTSPQTKIAAVRFKETYKGDKWDGARPDAPLKDEVMTVRVEPNSEEIVEFLWDSSGYAWFDDGRPRQLQRIKAELEETSKKIDETTKNLKISPKPVVLVHGLWSNWKQFEAWQNIFTTTHGYEWKSFPVGEKADKGAMDMGEYMTQKPGKSLSENAAALKSYVDYAQRDRNAWHVDMVAHSTGGLVARNYVSQLMPEIQKDGRPQVSHLLLLGTPNTGSPCADMMYKVTGNKPLYQATSEFTAGFNPANSEMKGVKFSALAGNSVPAGCFSLEANDGFVIAKSAKWTIKDTADSKSLHPELTGTVDFSNFVKPRLAIGPKGNHNPDIPIVRMPPNKGSSRRTDYVDSLTASRGPFLSDADFVEDSNETAQSDDFSPDFTKTVKLSPKQSVEIEIPVEQANNFGLTFMASSEISATLLNERGEIVGKNLTKTPEANTWFRSIFYDKATVKATWKLRLENSSDKELTAILAAWKNAVK